MEVPANKVSSAILKNGEKFTNTNNEEVIFEDKNKNNCIFSLIPYEQYYQIYFGDLNKNLQNNATKAKNDRILKKHQELTIQNAGNDKYNMVGSNLNGACGNYHYCDMNDPRIKITKLIDTNIKIGYGLFKPSLINDKLEEKNYQLYITSPQFSDNIQDNPIKKEEEISHFISVSLKGLEEINILNKKDKKDKKELQIKALMFFGSSDAIFAGPYQNDFLLNTENFNTSSEDNIIYYNSYNQSNKNKYVNVPQIISGLLLVASAGNVEGLENIIIANPAISFIVRGLLSDGKVEFIKKLKIFLNKVQIDIGDKLIGLYENISNNKVAYNNLLNDKNYSDILNIYSNLNNNDKVDADGNIIKQSETVILGNKDNKLDLQNFDILKSPFLSAKELNGFTETIKTDYEDFTKDFTKDFCDIVSDSVKKKLITLQDNTPEEKEEQKKLNIFQEKITLVKTISQESNKKFKNNSLEFKMVLNNISKNYLENNLIAVDKTFVNSCIEKCPTLDKKNIDSLIADTSLYYLQKELDLLPNKNYGNTIEDKNKFEFNGVIVKDGNKNKLILTGNKSLFDGNGKIEIIFDEKITSTALLLLEIRQKGFSKFIENNYNKNTKNISIYNGDKIVGPDISDDKIFTLIKTDTFEERESLKIFLEKSNKPLNSKKR